MEIRILRGQAVHDGLDFCHRLLLGLARHGTSLDLHRARRRVRAQSAAAASIAACSEGGPTSGCGGRARSSRSSSLSLAEELPHLHIGVDSQLEPAAMCRAARHVHFDPQVALVRQADFERRGLGHDRAIHFDAREHVAGAEAPVLLIRHRRHQDVAAQPRAAILSALAAAMHAASEPFIS